MSIRKTIAKFLHNIADALGDKPQQQQPKKTPWELYQEDMRQKWRAGAEKARREFDYE